MENKEITFKIMVNHIVSGFIYQGGEIEGVSQLLREVADDYDEKIKEEKES